MPKGSKGPQPDQTLSHSGALWFLVFTVSNSLLAYSHFSIGTKAWVGILGLLLPVYLSLRIASPMAKTRLLDPSPDPLPSIPGWALVTLFVVAIFLRTYHWTDLSVWPMWDDAHHAYFAISLAEKWHWQCFFSQEQFMPFYIWLQGLFFKITGPSLSTMWLYPLLYALVLVPLGYFSARAFFPRSLALLYAWILGFSFWPLYIPCFSTDIGLCLIWEHVVFILLALWYRSATSQNHHRVTSRFSILCGLAVGVGWYLSKFWLPNILVATLAVLYWFPKKITRSKEGLGLFLAVMAVPLLPMALLILDHQYGAHIFAFLVPGFHSEGQARLLDSLSYGTSLLWGPLEKAYFGFGPRWGGVLNPLMGSCFLLGILALWKSKDKRAAIFFALAFLIYLAQGFLSNNWENMRTVPLMPCLFLLTADGIRILGMSLPRTFRYGFLSLLLLTSFSLDLYHLWGPYHAWAQPSQASGLSKPPELYRAYWILKDRSKALGPGLVFDQFTCDDLFNQSLLVATYPFNAASNPNLSPSSVQWAGVILDPAYSLDLQRTFPLGHTFPLSEGLDRGTNALSLFITPVAAQDLPRFLQWVEAQKVVRTFYPDIPYDQPVLDYRKVIEDYQTYPGLFQEDPFLRAFYWSRLGEYAWRQKDDALYLDASKNMLRFVKPNGRLDYRLGLLELKRGDYSGAKSYFLKAGNLDEEYRIPLEKLQWLDKMAKDPRPE